jgi:hypothetical protein
MSPSLKTLKRLFARSCNRCAFQGCNQRLVDKLTDSVIGEICHIKARNKGGPRYDPHQTDEDRHGSGNLILMCGSDHKKIDEHPEVYTVAVLLAMKASHESNDILEIGPGDAKGAAMLLQQYAIHIAGDMQVGTIHAHNVTIRSRGRSMTPIVPSPEIVAGSPQHRRYLQHLIKRYHEFAATQQGRDFNYAAVYKAIERKFGAAWDWLPISHFDEVATFLQKKIDQTIIGKGNRSRDKPNYSNFEEYCEKYRL